MPIENALDRMWERLDELTDWLIDDGHSEIHGMRNTEQVRAQAAATSWCIAQFYGGDTDYVRETVMGRRARRERG